MSKAFFTAVLSWKARELRIQPCEICQCAFSSVPLNTSSNTAPSEWKIIISCKGIQLNDAKAESCFFFSRTHTHMYTEICMHKYVYMKRYIYICVCVCAHVFVTSSARASPAICFGHPLTPSQFALLAVHRAVCAWGRSPAPATTSVAVFVDQGTLEVFAQAYSYSTKSKMLRCRTGLKGERSPS